MNESTAAQPHATEPRSSFASLSPDQIREIVAYCNDNFRSIFDPQVLAAHGAGPELLASVTRTYESDYRDHKTTLFDYTVGKPVAQLRGVNGLELLYRVARDLGLDTTNPFSGRGFQAQHLLKIIEAKLAELQGLDPKETAARPTSPAAAVPRAEPAAETPPPLTLRPGTQPFGVAPTEHQPIRPKDNTLSSQPPHSAPLAPRRLFDEEVVRRYHGRDARGRETDNVYLDDRSILRARPQARLSVIFNFGSSLYGGDVGQAIVRNLLNNAADALRALPDPRRGKVVVRIDTKENALYALDNGRGMPPKVALNEFLEPGESTTRSFGIGTVVVFISAKRLTVTTTADDLLTGKRLTTTLTGGLQDYTPLRGFEVTVMETPDHPTGTNIHLAVTESIELGSRAVREQLANTLRFSRLPFHLDLTIDGRAPDE